MGISVLLVAIGSGSGRNRTVFPGGGADFLVLTGYYVLPFFSFGIHALVSGDGLAGFELGVDVNTGFLAAADIAGHLSRYIAFLGTETDGQGIGR